MSVGSPKRCDGRTMTIQEVSSLKLRRLATPLVPEPDFVRRARSSSSVPGDDVADADEVALHARDRLSSAVAWRGDATNGGEWRACARCSSPPAFVAREQ
jgi:hypothetical protein